jgi:hypothetical protein
VIELQVDQPDTLILAECSRQQMHLHVIYKKTNDGGRYFRFVVDPDQLAALESGCPLRLVPSGPGPGKRVEAACQIVERNRREPFEIDMLHRIKSVRRAGVARKEKEMMVQCVTERGGAITFAETISDDAIARFESARGVLVLIREPKNKLPGSGRVFGECPCWFAPDREELISMLYK